MSARSAPSAIDDAEKGVVDQELVPIHVALPLAHSDSSMTASTTVSSTTACEVVPPKAPSEKPEAPSSVVPRPPALVAPAKKLVERRRASRWVRFQLWFNTYRYARISGTIVNYTPLMPYFEQKILYNRHDFKSHRYFPHHPGRLEIPTAVHWCIRSWKFAGGDSDAE